MNVTFPKGSFIQSEDVSRTECIDLQSKTLNTLTQKFQDSISQDSDSKVSYKERLHKEIRKFQLFLDKSIQGEIQDDLIYFSVGHGDVKEQIWPGFIFQSLMEGKKVKTILVEKSQQYPHEYISVSKDVLEVYNKYLGKEPSPKEIEVLDLISVNQFLCGTPPSEDVYYDDMRDDELEDKKLEESTRKSIIENYLEDLDSLKDPCIVKDPVELEPFIKTKTKDYANSNNTKKMNRKQQSWEKKDDAKNLLGGLRVYFEKCIENGKKVVLGYHIDAPWSLDNFEWSLYNSLSEKYPGKIQFLWGYSNLNRMTSQTLVLDDTNPFQPGQKWTYYKDLSEIRL